MQQRTDDWYLIRKARFTASEIINICESPQKRETTVFQKVHEAMMSAEVFLNIKYNERSSTAMEWGTLHEAEARQYFESLIGKTITEIGFVEYNRHSGGSPDGMIEEDSGQIEIKCPYNGLHHLKFMAMREQKELLDYSKYQAPGKIYYYQMQANMLFAKSNYCEFLSFDPRLKGRLRGNPLLILPDKAIQEEIKDSIDIASKMKEEILEDLVQRSRVDWRVENQISGKKKKQKELII